MKIVTEFDTVPEKQIRAYYTREFIRVYQAYSDVIADSALSNGTFISPPFSMTRMTWIKPSFLWMMYRSGWGEKDPGQKRILAIDITHEGFQSIFNQGVLSSNHENNDTWKNEVRKSDVVIQWDPERDLQLSKLPFRTIQLGLRNQAVKSYVDKWITNITDITDFSKNLKELVDKRELSKASSLLPIERVYKP
ncbi:DUF4291 domain-containing protein [Serratia rubidaea]|uniref:DUF4291 domain-containing protein n=1 Tax=Serratia rubidaea TaxID=61652 RepID=A0ABS0MK26_SERRU|nr:DUF4291 domain-containing protein [Serratia rubidaea]MBH1932687.1 DUF4291 domain-containing protein [Serratia rubidaea]